jgi:hypothetical protein
VRHHDGGAVRVAERDVHDLPVPAGGAEGGARDPDRSWCNELGEVTERVVLGVPGDGVARSDGDDAGARVSACTDK